MPHISHAEVRQVFLEAFNSTLGNKAAIVGAYQVIVDALTDVTELDAEHDALEREIEVISSLMRQCVAENAAVALDQHEYHKRYNGLMARMDATVQRRGEVEVERAERTAKRTRMETFIQVLAKQGSVVTDFDVEL